jgi:Zn-dependent protease
VSSTPIVPSAGDVPAANSGANISCPRCLKILSTGALVCDQCHTLVHTEKLEQLSAGAKLFEEQRHPAKARAVWLQVLELLPQESAQAQWVRNRTAMLATRESASAAHESQHKWAKRLGPLAPLAIALTKIKVLFALFQLKFLLTLGAFVAFYWAMFGAKFGMGFAAMILIHEMGHYVDMKRRGLPADMPVFLPGLGAYVRWHALGVSDETRAAVSLAGPLAGGLAAAVCALVWWKTGNDIWAALARAGAWLNVLNLTPVWILDGGQAVTVLNKVERIILMTVCLILWLLVDEKIFFLVAAGFAWRIFTRDIPARPNPSTAAYFAVVLITLGVILRFTPYHAGNLP